MHLPRPLLVTSNPPFLHDIDACAHLQLYIPDVAACSQSSCSAGASGYSFAADDDISLIASLLPRQVAAVAGVNVLLMDTNEAALERSLAGIASSLRRAVSKQKLDAATAEAAMARIAPHRELEVCSPAPRSLRQRDRHAARLGLPKQPWHNHVPGFWSVHSGSGALIIWVWAC